MAEFTFQEVQKSDVELLKRCANLILQRYSEKGFYGKVIGENVFESEAREIKDFLTQDRVRTFAAVHHSYNGRGIVATLSIIEDDPESKLPVDSVYSEESKRLRNIISDCYGTPARISEITKFASLGKNAKDVFKTFGAPVIVELFRLVYEAGKREGLHGYALMCSLKHQRKYKRCFGFEEFGAHRDHPTLKNADTTGNYVSLQPTPTVVDIFFAKHRYCCDDAVLNGCLGGSD